MRISDWSSDVCSSDLESISENASDTVEAYIGNLDEGVYSFTIYSFDKEGNRSIPLITENVKIYGDKYQGGLLNRQVSSIDYADGKTFLFWNRPDPINHHTEVSYTNQAGKQQTFIISKKEERRARKECVR